MNKRFNIASLGMMCLVLVSVLFIVSACDNGDDLSTNQMRDTGITVKAFGPSPALRGGELRFVGTNVDRATAVVIPGVPEITEFTKKEKTEIRVIIPQTAQEGYVVLRTPQGDITPKTMLTFLEPIVIESITTAKVKTGDDFEIKGDYLNLIAKVVFQENVVVESADFISQSREKIVVKVPLKARSGEIMIANGAEIPVEVYSGDLQADIVEPVIASVSPSTAKAGSDITITGTDFDLVEKVIFGGEKIAPKFTISEDKKSITATVPADAQDGPVMLVAYSGVEIVSETSLTLKMPVAAIENKKVKNGETITVTGTDLDLVTAVWFDELEAEFSYADGKLSVIVPETAVSDHIKFVTASTKDLSITGITYVAPAISSIAPTSITAGDNITITGTDLDLVREIIFSAGEGTASVTLASAPDANNITIQSPFTATSGKVDLKTVNATIVTSSQSLTIAPALLAAITEMPEAVKPGALVTVKGINLNTVTKVEFRYANGTIIQATSFLPNQDGTSLQMYSPATLGKVDLILTNPVGPSVAYPLSIGLTDPIVDPSLIIFDFENGVAADGRWGGVGQESTEDGISGKYYEITAANWKTEYWWFADNWRYGYPSVSNKSDYFVKMDVRLRTNVPVDGSEVRVMLAGKVVNILPYLSNGTNWTTGGDWKTISIPLTEWKDLADPTPSAEGEWGMTTYIAGANFTGFCIDNIRYEKK
jgi:hypothetical protein